MMHRNKSVDVHSFAMVPRSDVPRSSFKMERTYKTTFDAGYLVPVFCEEMLPGDTFNTKMTGFARLTTPIVPIMDNLYMDVFFFFCPNRLVWTNWVKFMGEQNNPSDSISYVIPQSVSPAGGYAIGSIHDYFGLPTVGQVTAGATVSHSVLPLRAYSLIWDQWFRDENLQNSVIMGSSLFGDGPDTYSNYGLFKRGKRHDYFTSALPWTQKGSVVQLPMVGNATVKTSVSELITSGPNPAMMVRQAGGSAAGAGFNVRTQGGVGGGLIESTSANATGTNSLIPTNLYADLSTVTAATINQLRQSFQIQKLLERDARGGTRYTELVQAHFGVRSPDARLQRPEYLGGGSFPITISPIAQTSATGLSGGSTPGGNLNAVGTGLVQSGFTYASTEHGYVIGLVSVRADLTYQQGLRKHWSRSTRYDYYFPAFAMLGEQPIYNREIYCTGDVADASVFGYQERWAEYRYLPSEITGKLRSTASGTLDVWHLAQKFTALPALNTSFIQEAPPISRISAVPSEPQFKLDAFFSVKAARPLPMYSVPGLIDHF